MSPKKKCLRIMEVERKTKRQEFLITHFILKNVYGPVTEHGDWKKSVTDKELKESYEKPTVVLDINRKGFVWLGHIIRKG